MNLAEKLGLANFARKAKEHGIVQTEIEDLPIEESIDISSTDFLSTGKNIGNFYFLVLTSVPPMGLSPIRKVMNLGPSYLHETARSVYEHPKVEETVNYLKGKGIAVRSTF